MLSQVPSENLAQVIDDIIIQQPNLVPYIEQIFHEQGQLEQQQMHGGQVELIEDEQLLQQAILAMTGKQSMDQVTQEEYLGYKQLLLNQSQQ